MTESKDLTKCFVRKILDLLENESTTSNLFPRSTSYLITIWLQITSKDFREYPRGDSSEAYK